MHGPYRGSERRAAAPGRYGPSLSPTPHILPPRLTPFSPEFDLLRLCARPRLRAGDAERVRVLLAGPLDWSRVLPLAMHHGVEALLEHHVNALAPGASPEGPRTGLRLHVSQCVDRTRRGARELVRLGEAFAGAGLRVLTLKGPSLARLAYGELALRPSNDIDLLVDRAEMPRVRELLQTEGYREQGPTGPLGTRRAFLARQFSFVGGGRRVTALDVHTALLPPLYTYQPSFDALWSRSGTVSVENAGVSTLHAADLLLALCYHGAKNRWQALKYVGDVTALVESTGIDWEMVFREMRAHRSRIVLYTGVLLAHRLMSTDIPEEILEAARRDVRLDPLVGRCIQALAERPGPENLAYRARVRFNLELQDGLYGRARYAGFSLLRRMTDWE